MYIRVRIRATGQVLDMVPAVARAMIGGGLAEEAKENVLECAALDGGDERALSPRQNPRKKRAAR